MNEEMIAEMRYWDEELFDEDDPTVDYLYGYCECGWRGTGVYWRGDEKDQAATIQGMCALHHKTSPLCTCIPQIG